MGAGGTFLPHPCLRGKGTLLRQGAPACAHPPSPAARQPARAVAQGNPSLLEKYSQSHLQSYLEDNARVAFCPSAPWCGHAIEVRDWWGAWVVQGHSAGQR